MRLWVTQYFVRLCVVLSIAATGCALLAAQPPQRRPTLALRGVRSGKAILEQRDRVTFLNLTLPSSPAISVLLTHKGKYPQWTDGPFRSRLIAEVPGKFLIFTDTLASNPTNIQGECGASRTGERYLHVISLFPPLRETFSTLVESCWLDLVPEPGSPSFNPSGQTISVRFTPDSDKASQSYRIAPDSSVVPILP